MTRTGETTVLADTIDGVAMGKINFVLRDARDRIWITVSTRHNPWSEACRPDLTDGYVALLDERGLRVVADGLSFANEIRLDADEEWLYVAGTARRRVTRMGSARMGGCSIARYGGRMGWAPASSMASPLTRTAICGRR